MATLQAIPKWLVILDKGTDEMDGLTHIRTPECLCSYTNAVTNFVTAPWLFFVNATLAQLEVFAAKARTWMLLLDSKNGASAFTQQWGWVCGCCANLILCEPQDAILDAAEPIGKPFVSPPSANPFLLARNPAPDESERSSNEKNAIKLAALSGMSAFWLLYAANNLA
jgi:hypothetical protein